MVDLCELAAGSRLESLAIGQLHPHPRNPRLHKPAQVRAIAKSIEAFGFNAPVLIDRENNIVAGHGRVEAAKLLGIERVPVVRLEHLTKNQARAYMLADNKLNDLSDWDNPALAVHLKELSELALDFDIEAIGFEIPEIDFRVQSLEPADIADGADVFEHPGGPAVSRTGDLWLLGEHRLLCGSALDAATYTTLLDGKKAAAVFTDPPYNVPIAGHVGGSGATKHREFLMASGEMALDEFGRFLKNSFGAIATHSDQGALIYGFMDWRHLTEMAEAGHFNGFDLINLCVWVKSNGGMGSLYRSRHELVFVFRNGKNRHQNNVQLGRFGRNRTNVWNYPGANSFSRKGHKSTLDLHPTAKPIALVADALLDATRPKDVVLDPFLGSGTTLLAAERTGRRGHGIELDALYVDTAILRWEKMTACAARHVSGATFSDLRTERGFC